MRLSVTVAGPALPFSLYHDPLSRNSMSKPVCFSVVPSLGLRLIDRPLCVNLSTREWRCNSSVIGGRFVTPARQCAANIPMLPSPRTCILGYDVSILESMF